jgi:plasmid stabilization system protein ParE
VAKPKRSARFTARAEQDLGVIAAFTEKQWGREQVVPYLRVLQGMVEHLLEYPQLGLPVSGRTELRFPLEAHVIYYRKVAGGIEVTRILHGAQHRRR